MGVHEIYKTLKKEIEEDIRWENHSCSWVSRINNVKILTAPH
jgi:hypothetical protein